MFNTKEDLKSKIRKIESDVFSIRESGILFVLETEEREKYNRKLAKVERILLKLVGDWNKEEVCIK